MRTLYKYVADISRCPCNCKEPCIEAYDLWGVWGKICVVDPADVEQNDIVAGCIKAKHACLYDLIQVKLHY